MASYTIDWVGSAVGRSLLGSLGLLMQYWALCWEALVFPHVSLHRRDQNSST